MGQPPVRPKAPRQRRRRPAARGEVAVRRRKPPQAQAPIDLTGWWVSVVTEDWRWRMVTPPKGDYSSIPINNEGRRVGDTWDPAKDEREGNACKSYGAAAIMRVPGTSPHHLAGREHAEDRHRRRHADAPAALR